MSEDRSRIAFVIDDLGFGGAQRQLLILAEGLSEFVVPHVYCLSNVTYPFGARLRDKGIPVTVLERRSHLDFVRLLRLRKSLQIERTGVVHGFLDASNVYSYLATRGTGIPLLLSLRNERLSLTGARARALHHALRKADGVLVNSTAGQRYLTGRIRVKPENVFLVRNAVSIPPQSGNGTNDSMPAAPTIGFVGRLVPQKRIGLLIEGFAILLKSYPNARLVLIGDGEEKIRLQALVQKKGLGDAVTMPGTMENAAERMRDFTCLVLPSEFEGTPNVALEALASGVPVVASPVGDLEEIVIEGRTGLLLRDSTPDTVASALNNLLGDEALRGTVRTEGPLLVADKYSTESAVEGLLEVYRSLKTNK